MSTGTPVAAGTTASVAVPLIAGRRRTGWPHDVVLGVRLAVGGGRTSWARLLLGAIGIGLATAVLLIAASIGHFTSAQSARSHASFGSTTPVPGVAPLNSYGAYTQYRGVDILGAFVRPTGADSPLPPGVSRLPGPGEIVVSPALAKLLASSDGALLRPRFPQRVIGQISQAGLDGPQMLRYYAGPTDAQLRGATLSQPLYSFGEAAAKFSSNPALYVLAIVAAVALLMPILIMVSVSSRIAGVQRDRRLAALRLVGAGSRQVRRIAAAESLIPAAVGLVLGAVLFLGFRQIVPNIELDGLSAFTSDITPPVPLVVLIVLLVPVLAVVVALIAMRRTVIEPLGVVRGGKPVNRRLWWRIALVVLGVVTLLYARRLPSDGRTWIAAVAFGSAALLVGVPILLPWLLERVVSRVRGGAPSWQLAVRRLQLDSGTPARVVGGVAVVLAGAITLQIVLFSTGARVRVADATVTSTSVDANAYVVSANSGNQAQVDAAIEHTGLVHDVEPMTFVNATATPNVPDGDNTELQISSCAVIRRITGLTGCIDGDVFELSGMGALAPPNTTLTLLDDVDMENGTDVRAYGRWTVPAHVTEVPEPKSFYGPVASLIVTPGAIRGVTLPIDNETSTMMSVDPGTPDAIEYLRNALAAFPLTANVSSASPTVELNLDQRTYEAIRNFLLVGALFTLALAGVSLLVLALEQVRERRRPLAMLSASGVPRGMLARSLLWQTAVPVGVGVVAAVLTGIGLAKLLLGATGTTMTVDWADVGVFSAAAVVLTLVVTAATFPALRNATRLSALRTE